MRPLFRLTDPYSIEQYRLITKLLRKFPDSTMIVYQSNWYITVACWDFYTASEVRAKLMRLTKPSWQIEIAPGRKNKVRHYLSIQLLRE